VITKVETMTRRGTTLGFRSLVMQDILDLPRKIPTFPPLLVAARTGNGAPTSEMVLTEQPRR
jgi:hypothetical protein